MTDPHPTGLFDGYDLGGFFDEMFASDGHPHPWCARLLKSLSQLSPQEMDLKRELADLAMLNQGITFTVYGDEKGIEKPFPFDLVPRVLPYDEWTRIEAGLKQRVRALNLFLADVYDEGLILRDRVVPRDLVVGARDFRHELLGSKRPDPVPVNICGTDLIRGADGAFHVLEDNCRTPSGVSYVLQNRILQMRTFPNLFRENAVLPVDHYPQALMRTLLRIAPPGIEDPVIVVLTPGRYNSAYFEHTFLAMQMGVHLVEGHDLFVDDNKVYMKTTGGPQRVHVVYRRIDDDFIDPLVFRPDSMLGVPGIVNAYRARNVSLANGLGTGVADDKAIYPYVPRMIRYYLDQDPILPNVETHLATEELEYIEAHAHELVLKATNESGGYGILIGPQSTKKEREAYLEQVRANPRGYIAQPLVPLSRCPCYLDGTIQGRHVDLRPYILCTEDEETIVPGGLTRVALRKGSYVVNSSQGGGSKDTWVLAPISGQTQSQSQGGLF